MSTVHSTTPSRKTRPGRTLVVGLGNILLTDDGVGVHAVRELRKILPRRILAVEVGTAVLDALHLFEWADRIIGIDAMQAGGPPGTIYSFAVEDVEDQGVKASLHEVGLVAGLRFMKSPRPPISILAVEPETMECGLELSASVREALPKLVAEAKRMAES
jgi:hydrogenase maturation protease